MLRSSTTMLLAGLLCAAPAMAEVECDVPMTDWQPREAVLRLAQDNGWDLRRIRIDDGCYEVIGFDAQGRVIEVKLEPATLEVVGIDYEDHSRGGADRDDRDDRDDRGETKSED